MDNHHNLQIFADYFQIWLQDAQTTSTQRDFLFSDQHLSDSVWAREGLIILFTARNMTVPVELQIIDNEPDDDLGGWDHVAEVAINIPSGKLEVFGCGGYSNETLFLQPGTYRVRMYHTGLASLSENGLEGNDQYKLIIWPGITIKPRVLKRWTPS